MLRNSCLNRLKMISHSMPSRLHCCCCAFRRAARKPKTPQKPRRHYLTLHAVRMRTFSHPSVLLPSDFIILFQLSADRSQMHFNAFLLLLPLIGSATKGQRVVKNGDDLARLFPLSSKPCSHLTWYLLAYGTPEASANFSGLQRALCEGHSAGGGW